jgi:hypothetical protein
VRKKSGISANELVVKNEIKEKTHISGGININCGAKILKFGSNILKFGANFSWL